MAVIRELGRATPILGVCLGHQAIGAVFGGAVVRAAVPMHGKTSTIEHNGRGVFSGLAGPFVASRYHSLVVADEPAAGGARGDGADARGPHHHGPAPPDVAVHGVQFHPESILTGEGRRILRNFLDGRLD